MPKSPYMTNDFKKEVVRYALHDARTTFMLWKNFAKQMPPHEWEISRMTREMGMRGVPVNMDKLRAAEAKLIEEKRRTEALLPWIGGEYPPLSLQAIRDQCEKEGIRSPKSFAEKIPKARHGKQSSLTSSRGCVLCATTARPTNISRPCRR